MIDLGFLVNFSLFGGGLLGAFENALIWFLFIYGSARINSEHPIEHVIDFLTPIFFMAFVMTFFGIPDLIVGFAVLLALFVGLKYFEKIPLRPWISMSIRISILMIFNNQFGPFVGRILLWFLIAWIFVEAEIKNRRKLSKEKKKEKKD